MAAYPVAANERGAHAKTLAATVVDTVTFDRDCDSVEVLSHDGASPIYFTVDGSTPEVAGQNTDVVPFGALQVDVPTSGGTAVRLIAAADVVYSVTGSAR